MFLDTLRLQKGGLRPPRAVFTSPEQVPPQRGSGHPIGAAARRETLAAGFECSHDLDLRQQLRLRQASLSLRQIESYLSLQRFGALFERLCFRLRHTHLDGRRRPQGARESVPGGEWRSHPVVQARLRQFEIVLGADETLLLLRAADSQREHIGIGRHPGLAQRQRAFEIGLGGRQRFFGYLVVFARQHHAVVGARDCCQHIHPGLPLLLPRHLQTELRAAPPVASLVAVKDHVLGGQLRGKIRKCVGPVQAWEVEVRSLEAVLLEQRAEDVNRIITPLERFGIIHLWEIPSPSRGHPLAGSTFGRVGGTQGGVVVERQPDSLLQAERFLCLQRRWPSQHSQRRHARQEANRNQCFSQPARRFPPSAIVLE